MAKQRTIAAPEKKDALIVIARPNGSHGEPRPALLAAHGQPTPGKPCGPDFQLHSPPI